MLRNVYVDEKGKFFIDTDVKVLSNGSVVHVLEGTSFNKIVTEEDLKAKYSLVDNSVKGSNDKLRIGVKLDKVGNRYTYIVGIEDVGHGLRYVCLNKRHGNKGSGWVTREITDTLVKYLKSGYKIV